MVTCMFKLLCVGASVGKSWKCGCGGGERGSVGVWMNFCNTCVKFPRQDGQLVGNTTRFTLQKINLSRKMSFDEDIFFELVP